MNSPKIRKPAVAGQFYSSSCQSLLKEIESLIDLDCEKVNAIACMLPHAGYMYSGRVVGKTLSSMLLKEKIILLGPNHTGYGEPFSVMTEGSWQTPLSDAAIDSHLAKELVDNSKYLKEDDLAHTYEHSLEVELPFIQYYRKNFTFVPISFLTNDMDALKDVGREIAATVEKLNLKNSLTIIASSDMTHYEPKSEAQKKDKEAIDAILELDEDALVRKIKKFGISMCGYAPVVAMLSAVKNLGAKKGKLIKYATSGDTTGDEESVVGYAGIIFY